METLAVQTRGETLAVRLVIVTGTTITVALMDRAPIGGVSVRQTAAASSRLKTNVETSKGIPHSIPQSTPSPNDSIPHHDEEVNKPFFILSSSIPTPGRRAGRLARGHRDRREKFPRSFCVYLVHATTFTTR